MPPTSYSYFKTEPFATDDGGSDVGLVSWGYNEGGFWGRGRVESEVSDVGL